MNDTGLNGDVTDIVIRRLIRRKIGEDRSERTADTTRVNKIRGERDAATKC